MGPAQKNYTLEDQHGSPTNHPFFPRKMIQKTKPPFLDMFQPLIFSWCIFSGKNLSLYPQQLLSFSKTELPSIQKLPTTHVDHLWKFV